MSASARTRRSRILVVEDDELSAMLAIEALSMLNCDVRRARDGDEAVALVFQTGFDLVFMDYHLPGMNGLESTVRIREREALGLASRTAIVGLTASAMPEEQAACRQSGMDDVLLKPFRLLDLHAMVARWAPSPAVRPAGSAMPQSPPRTRP